MFGWFQKKTEIQKLIERDGLEKAIEECASFVASKITKIDVYRQFILEELDAAQHGNAEAKAFVRSTGIPAEDYDGAMRNSWEAVDGAGGPQQTLVAICMELGDDSEYVARFRIAVVKKLMSLTKPEVLMAAGFAAPKRKVTGIRSEADIERLIREQGMAVAGETLRRAALDGNLVCQVAMSQFALTMLEKHPADKELWNDCETFTKLAAEQGDPGSQFNLGKLYFDAVDGSSGFLRARDHELIKKAKFWHRKAAAQGLAESIAQVKELEVFPDDAYENVLESNRSRQELREKAPKIEPDEDCPF